MPCSEPGSERYAFNFKGEVVNNTLSGPGKVEFLKLLKKSREKYVQPDKRLEDVCFNFKYAEGNMIRTAIGTFVNGTLEGLGNLLSIFIS